MDTKENTQPSGSGYRPIFADQETITRMLGIPEGTLRELAKEMVVACHKLGKTKQSKTVYFFDDCENWVREREAPEWVLASQMISKQCGRIAH